MTGRPPARAASLALEVRSSLPGRVRWHFGPLRRDARRAAAVARALGHVPGVRHATASPVTATVLAAFDPDAVDADRLEETLAGLLALDLATLEVRHAHHGGESHQGHAHAPAASCDHDHGDACGGHDHGHDHSDGELARRRVDLYVGGGVLAGLLARRWLMGAVAAGPVWGLMAAGAALVTGWSFVRGGWRAVRRGRVTTDTLVSSATIASVFTGESITALIVIWLLNLGEYLQSVVLRRTRKAIRDLLTLDDEVAWLVVDGSEVERPVAALHAGDVVAVYSGRRIPVDGVVVGGSAGVNEAPITGESMPVWRNPGDEVFAGTVVMNGELKVRVVRIGHETVVGRLIRRVEDAQASRAPIQTVGEGFSRRFVPASFLLALVVFAVTRDIRRALTMLLVACPCASGLATPTAVSAAIGNGARRGILIKGGRPLEAAAGVDTVVFDKTGTLTLGQPVVQRVTAVSADYDAEAVLRHAANAERHSEHPLAAAVLAHARGKEMEIPPHDECRVIVGRGMHADWAGHRVLVGNGPLMQQFGIEVPVDVRARFRQHAGDGETMMYVAHQDRVIGIIGVRDQLRPEAQDAVARLRAAGVRRTIMLTGDGEDAAAAIARETGIDEFQWRLLPEQKYEVVKRLREQGAHVAMIGDGINDAPALALADVGIAMGTVGSDVAIETADIALAADDLRRVSTTIAMSRKTLGVIRENYTMALGVNAGGVVLGALGRLNPFFAAILHNLSTLLVVANSARLIAYDPDAGAPASRT